MLKKITAEWEDGTVFGFPEEFDEDENVVNGEWTSPYPNTQEDSLVFGLMEVWAQGSGAMTDICWDHGEPIKVTIQDA